MVNLYVKSSVDSNIERDSLDDMVIEFKFGQVSVTKVGVCPKEVQVRTSQCYKGRCLSEGRSSSDKLVLQRQVFVRRKIKFGQVSVTKAGDCPKGDQVRTS
jgi:hypothetical protein